MQHESQQASERKTPQIKPTSSVEVRGPEVTGALTDSATGEYLQRTIGNRALGALAGDDASQSPSVQRAAIQAIVQRHPIVNGVHTAHKGKDKKHSDSEENAALKTAQETWEGIQASVQNDVLPGTSNATSALLPAVLVAYNTIKLQFDISEASASKRHINAIRQLFQKIEGRKGTIEMRVGQLKSAEDREAASRIASSVPNLLSRVEATTRSGAQCAKRAVGALSSAAASKELQTATRDLVVAEEQIKRIDAALLSVANYGDMVANVQVHKSAADAAMLSLRASVQAIQGIFNALKRVDEAQEALDDTREDAAQLDAAEEVVRQIEEQLVIELELSRNFFADLAEVAKRTQFSNGASEQDLRAERDAVVQTVRDSLAEARQTLQAVRDAVARVPGEEEDLRQAKLGATAATAGVVTAADTEITRIDDQQALRELAGGEGELTALKVDFANGAKLLGLLEALGVSRLQNWQKAPTIGPAKATALYDALGKDKLKTFVFDVGSGWCDTLIGTMSIPDIVELADDTKLGSKKLGDLIGRFGFTDVLKLITGITLAKVKTLIEQFSKAELTKSKLSVDQLIDLHTTFTAVKLKHWFTTFGDESILDFLTKYTAATLDVFITAVGEPRFEVLVRDKKLKANALHHYGAVFLKDFAGATAAAMHHLNTATVIYNTDGKGNRISGGHDPAAFNAALNRVITPAVPPVMNGPNVVQAGRPPVLAGRSFNSVAVGTECTKVNYELHNFNGTVMPGGGEKTLITALAGQQAVWQNRGNEAIWSSIRALNCDTTTRKWNGSSVSGFALKGYLAMDKKSVATFYPA